jgi:hypothetical protein
MYLRRSKYFGVTVNFDSGKPYLYIFHSLKWESHTTFMQKELCLYDNFRIVWMLHLVSGASEVFNVIEPILLYYGV